MFYLRTNPPGIMERAATAVFGNGSRMARAATAVFGDTPEPKFEFTTHHKTHTHTLTQAQKFIIDGQLRAFFMDGIAYGIVLDESTKCGFFHSRVDEDTQTAVKEYLKMNILNVLRNKATKESNMGFYFDKPTEIVYLNFSGAPNDFFQHEDLAYVNLSGAYLEGIEFSPSQLASNLCLENACGSFGIVKNKYEKFVYRKDLDVGRYIVDARYFTPTLYIYDKYNKKYPVPEYDPTYQKLLKTYRLPIPRHFKVQQFKSDFSIAVMSSDKAKDNESK
jgi:hypothetical protein